MDAPHPACGSVRPRTIARLPNLDRHAVGSTMGSSAREQAGGRSDVVSEGVGVVAQQRTMTQAPSGGPSVEEHAIRLIVVGSLVAYAVWAFIVGLREPNPQQ